MTLIHVRNGRRTFVFSDHRVRGEGLPPLDLSRHAKANRFAPAAFLNRDLENAGAACVGWQAPQASRRVRRGIDSRRVRLRHRLALALARFVSPRRCLAPSALRPRAYVGRECHREPAQPLRSDGRASVLRPAHSLCHTRGSASRRRALQGSGSSGRPARLPRPKKHSSTRAGRWLCALHLQGRPRSAAVNARSAAPVAPPGATITVASAVRRVTAASKREPAGGSALVMAGLGPHGLAGALHAVDDDDGTEIALGMGRLGAGEVEALPQVGRHQVDPVRQRADHLHRLADRKLGMTGDPVGRRASATC